jgi:hypothetical protein
MLFQLLRCSVALAGDNDQVIVRHRGNPIVFPELILLQFLHGEEAITDVHVVGHWDTTQAEVRQRLTQIYGPKYFGEVFTGAQPRLPLSDPTLPLCRLPIHVPGPTRADSPDPIIKPLDQFTMADPNAPRVVSNYRDEPLPPDDVTLDALAGHGADDDEIMEGSDPLGLADVLTQVNLPSATAHLDPAASRSRDNHHGRGTSAPRTADHLPDVAQATLKEQTERNMRTRQRDKATADG